MRESSSNLVPSNSQKLNKIQGGDKKFMKKSLSLILALAMVFTMFASVAFAADAPAATPAATPPVTAATYTPQQAFDALKAAGIVEGDAVKGANLDANMTRAEFAKVIAKLWELPENAAGSTVYTDLAGASWAAGYIGAATKAGLLNGVGGNKFNPSGNVKVEEIAKVIATGFKLPTVTYAGTGKVSTWAKGFVGAVIAAKILDESADFTKAAKRSELFTVGIKGFVLYQDSKKPTPTPVPASKGLDLATAVAVNSKVIELGLNTAATAADANVANVTVKSEAGTAIVVSKVAIAPYSTDGKLVLVTLATDTASGILYTVTSGTTSANFGGISIDTAKPTVSKVESTDYNKVVVTFSERVDITKAVIALSLKYGTKAALAVTSTGYVAGDGTKVELTTADQTGDLYGSDISGVTDFAGNVADAISTLTFVGTVKDITTTLQPVAAPLTKTVDSKTVLVVFNKKPDLTTIAAVANYSLKEAYGTTPATIAVASVRVATDDDFLSNELTSDAKISSRAVVLTLGTALKDSTLYKLVLSGLKTYTGVAVDGTANFVTFVGVGPYSGAQDIASTTSGATITVLSNTKVKVSFARTQDTATLVAANFAIARTYGDKAVLAVSAIKVVNNKNVELTTASQTGDLYTLTLSNIKDVDGNLFDSAKNTKTFVGSAVASAIASIKTISLAADTKNKLSVTFDQNVGASATDISHYFINNSIGYPTKAVINSSNANQVDLTIPATTVINKLYTITVKNLENSDGIKQGSAITGTFIGNAVVATLPAAQGVQATDAQTIKVFFDRATDDDSLDVAGKLYISDATVKPYSLTGSNLEHGAFVLTTKLGNVDLSDIAGSYAYKDPTNANSLVISVPTANYFKVGNAPTSGLFTLTLNSSVVVSTSSANVLTVGPTVTDVSAITADNVVSTNSKTVKVWFNKPVVITDIANAFRIGNTASYADVFAYLSKPTALDTTNTVFEFQTSVAFADSSIKYLVANTSVTSAQISDYGHIVTVKDEDGSAGGAITQARQFGGNPTSATSITNINVIATDKKTLVIYYPEAMDSAAAILDTNYKLVNSSSSTASEIIYGWFATHAVASIYDSALNTVTFTFDSELPASTTGYFIWFDNTTLTNGTGVKKVETSNSDHTAITRQFAPSTTAAKLVTITGATYTDATSTALAKIKISLNQTATSATYATSAGILSQFAITIKTVAAPTGRALATSDISSVVFNALTDSVVINLYATTSNTLVDQAVGTVAFNVGTQNDITGLNGEKYDTASKTQFGQ